MGTASGDHTLDDDPVTGNTGALELQQQCILWILLPFIEKQLVFRGAYIYLKKKFFSVIINQYIQ
jgi:hypothetical protein